MPLGIPSRWRELSVPGDGFADAVEFRHRPSLDRAFHISLIAGAIGSRRTGTEIGPFTNKAG
jgi:hypothetical protein